MENVYQVLKVKNDYLVINKNTGYVVLDTESPSEAQSVCNYENELAVYALI